MPGILNSNDFGLKVYDRFPEKYREDDAKQGYSLKRYLQALSEGGYKHIIEGANELLNFSDSSVVSHDVLLKLYEQYGLKMFNGIPDEYLRSLLPYMSIVWNYKGSISVIEYVATTLSGVKVDIDLNYTADRSLIEVVIDVTSKASGDRFPDVEQFRRILRNFIPFYFEFLLVYYHVYADYAEFALRDSKQFDTIKDTKIETQNVSIVDEETSIVGIKQSYTENFGFYSKNEESPKSAVFATGATFGTAVFNTPGSVVVEECLDTVHFHEEENVNMSFEDSDTMTFGTYKETMSLHFFDGDTLKFSDSEQQSIKCAEEVSTKITVYSDDTAVLGKNELGEMLLGKQGVVTVLPY